MGGVAARLGGTRSRMVLDSEVGTCLFGWPHASAAVPFPDVAPYPIDLT